MDCCTWSAYRASGDALVLGLSLPGIETELSASRNSLPCTTRGPSARMSTAMRRAEGALRLVLVEATDERRWRDMVAVVEGGER